MSSGRQGRPDDSMTLITEMMERPLDPGYAAAAEHRQASGLAAATGLRGPTLIIAAVLIGVLLGASALALRAPTTAASKIKQDLVGRIEDRRAHADAQTRRIATLRNEINTAQAAALSQQSETALSTDLSNLELAAGTVPVTGRGCRTQRQPTNRHQPRPGQGDRERPADHRQRSVGRGCGGDLDQRAQAHISSRRPLRGGGDPGGLSASGPALCHHRDR